MSKGKCMLMSSCVEMVPLFKVREKSKLCEDAAQVLLLKRALLFISYISIYLHLHTVKMI